MRVVTCLVAASCSLVPLPSAAFPDVAVRASVGAGAEPLGASTPPLPGLALLPPLVHASAGMDVGYAVAPRARLAVYGEYARAAVLGGGGGWVGRSGLLASYRLVSLDEPQQVSVWAGIGGGVERAELSVRSRSQNFLLDEPQAPLVRASHLGLHATAQCWGEWSVARGLAFGPFASATVSPFWGVQVGLRFAFGVRPAGAGPEDVGRRAAGTAPR